MYIYNNVYWMLVIDFQSQKFSLEITLLTFHFFSKIKQRLKALQTDFVTLMMLAAMQLQVQNQFPLKIVVVAIFQVPGVVMQRKNVFLV